MRHSSHFLWRKPSAVRSGHLHLRAGEITTNPVRRVHGRHSTGSSRVGARPNTLRIGCAELKAVPHAGLGYHFLRVQVKPNGGWGSSNGSEAQSASTKSTSSDRQDDGGPCASAELKRNKWPPAASYNAPRCTKQVRFHNSLDGSSLAHAIQVSMGPLLKRKNNSTESL